MSYIETSTGLWEVVIGLEIHAQIISNSKLFSTASTKFGVAPNENVSLLDAALPGALPVINTFCIDQAIKTGLGLHGTINITSYFDRKNYFYPDLPSGYQITQFKHPIISGGFIDIEKDDGLCKKIELDHIHIEQDAGKSIHDQNPTKTYIDLNRAGIALMEIVTKPDMRDAEEVTIFIKKLRSILRYLKTCDGNMDEGSMRADVNVSLHRPGTELGTRAEIKNINSIKFMSIAIDYEAKRQIAILESGGKIDQETRLFDSSTGETRSMRSKENAQDYRYFPDPDLPPLILLQSRIDEIKKTIPELPAEKSKRLQDEYELSKYDADLISSEMEIAIFYENSLNEVDVNDKNSAKLLANWLLGDLFALLKQTNKSIDDIETKHFAELIGLIKNDVISGKIAKDVLPIMLETKKTAKIIVEENNWLQITDISVIEEVLQKVLDKNLDKVIQYKNGKTALFGFFIGQAMKKTQGKANPKLLNELLVKFLDEK